MEGSSQNSSDSLANAIKLINDTQNSLIDNINELQAHIECVINEIKEDSIQFVSPLYNNTFYGEEKTGTLNPYRFFFPKENSLSDFYKKSIYWKPVLDMLSKTTTECKEFVQIKQGEKWGIIKFTEGLFDVYNHGIVCGNNSFCECTFEICDQDTIKCLGRTTLARPISVVNNTGELSYVIMFNIPDYCIPIITQRFTKIHPQKQPNLTLPSKKTCEEFENMKKTLVIKENELKKIQQALHLEKMPPPLKYIFYPQTGLVYHNYPRNNIGGLF